MIRRSVRAALGTLGAALALGLGLALVAPPAPVFEAVIWQPDCATQDRIHDYRQVGASTLIVQWVAVEGQYFDGTGPDPCRIDWSEVQARSGGLKLVLGLQGALNPTPQALPELASASVALAHAFPLPVQGYYASAELHPEWSAAKTHAYLNALPRPLSVSAYAGPGQYTPQFADWLIQAVPGDVRLLLQDGVGVGHATPEQVAQVARRVQTQLGTERVAVIVEVFRRTSGPKFRSALPWELDGQLQAYRGLQLVAFDGGHYMSQPWMRALAAYRWLRGSP